MCECYGEVNAGNILSAGIPKLQSFGMTFRKAEYIMGFARKVQCGEFDLQNISELSDTEAIKELSALKESACGRRR